MRRVSQGGWTSASDVQKEEKPSAGGDLMMMQQQQALWKRANQLNYSLCRLLPKTLMLSIVYRGSGCELFCNFFLVLIVDFSFFRFVFYLRHCSTHHCGHFTLLAQERSSLISTLNLLIILHNLSWDGWCSSYGIKDCVKGAGCWRLWIVWREMCFFVSCCNRNHQQPARLPA